MYFQHRLEGTQWSDCIENYVTFAFQACSVTVQLLLTAYPRDLIFPMLLVNTIVFACCLAMVFATMPGTTFFVLTIVCAMLAGITCAGIQAGVYGIGGTLPPRYTQAIMSGQALGGVIVALSSVLFGFLPSIEDGAAGYFITAVVVLLACLITVKILPSLDFMAHYRRVAQDAEDSETLTRSQTPGAESLFRTTWDKVKGLGGWVGLNFFITLSVFPAVCSDVATYSFKSNQVRADHFLSRPLLSVCSRPGDVGGAVLLPALQLRGLGGAAPRRRAGRLRRPLLRERGHPQAADPEPAGLPAAVHAVQP